VPATFRSEAPAGEEDQVGLGALSISAVLAVALAALRGAATAIQDARTRRLERAAEAEPLRKARLKLAEARAATAAGLASGGTGTGSGGRRVPSSQEWGRTTLRPRDGAGRGSGGGSGGRGSGGGTGPTARHPSGTGGRPGAGSPSGGSSGTGTTKNGPGRGPGAGSGGRGPGNGSGSGGSGSGGTGRRGGGVGSALQQLAADRLQRRRDRMGTDGKPGGGSGGSAGSGSGTSGPVSLRKSRKPDTTGGTSGRQGGGTGGQSVGRTTLAQALADETHRRAQERLRARRDNPGEPFLRRHRKPPKDQPGKPGKDDPGTPPGAAAPGSSGAAGAPGGEAGPGWVPPPRGARRSAEESAAGATADQDVTITVEWPDRPGGPTAARTPAGALGRAVPGLPRAPHRPAGPRPGTTSPTKGTAPMASPTVRLPATSGGAAAEHMTDVTLDDVLDHLADSKRRCFDTYDECARLAAKATALKLQLAELAEELRERHNLIGHLTAAALTRLAEAMDLLARKATAMRGESLAAAEAVETAHDEMHDAYRPVQQAAADAGLSMPSARIHNEE
jgi:hypothetical protein